MGKDGIGIPVSNNESDQDERTYDIIVWMDHRAVVEAEQINRLVDSYTRRRGMITFYKSFR